MLCHDCMNTLMEQQETLNTCLNGCITTVATLNQDLANTKQERDSLLCRVDANEDAADRTVEQAAEAVQAAEKLSFLSEQQLFDMEKQFRVQEAKLLAAQAQLRAQQEENARLRAEVAQLKAEHEQEKAEEAKERVEAQWHLVQPAGAAHTPSQTDQYTEINNIFSAWGKNKGQSHVNEALNWLEVILSGKTVAMENGYNTIEMTLFDLGQRDAFRNVIVPVLLERKNLECFVQEHRRMEFDYRITVLNKNEAIPAIIVPNEEAMEAKPEEGRIEETVSQEFVPLQKESEEEDDLEEMRPSEMESIAAAIPVPAPKEKKRAKMISLD